MNAPPDDLHTRGRALWAEAGAGGLAAPLRELVHEAARLLDRLDRLHAILAGREDVWVTIYEGESGEVTLVVDKLLGEARQYALAYGQLVDRMQRAGIVGRADPVTDSDAGGWSDELAGRKRERERAALRLAGT